MITSIAKGQYGQWIITAEIYGHFQSKQYFGYTKKEAISLAKQELKASKKQKYWSKNMQTILGMIWAFLCIASMIWIGSDPHNGFICTLIFGIFIGTMAFFTGVSIFGQIWTALHIGEIIDEVCDGLFNRKG